MRYGSGRTKPGGHCNEIKDLQRGLKRDIKRYNSRCRCDDDDNNNPPLTRNVDELANKYIEKPVAPAAPSVPIVPAEMPPFRIPFRAPVVPVFP